MQAGTMTHHQIAKGGERYMLAMSREIVAVMCFWWNVDFSKPLRRN
jgi:hypothetical protein